MRVAEATGRRPEEEDVRDDLGNQKRDVSELNTGLVDQKQNAVMHTEDVGRQLEAEKIRARQAMPTSESSTEGTLNSLQNKGSGGRWRDANIS